METIELTELEREIVRLLEGCRGEVNALRRRNLVEMLVSLAGERRIRATIKHLVVDHGIPIASSAAGYFMPVSPEEVGNCCSYYRNYGLSILTIESRLRKISLPALVGQISMDLGADKK